MLSKAAFRSIQPGASLEFHLLLSQLYFFALLCRASQCFRSVPPSSLALLRQSVRSVALEVLALIVRLHSHDFLSRGQLNRRQQLPSQRPCLPFAIPLSRRQGSEVGSLTIKNSGGGASNADSGDGGAAAVGEEFLCGLPDGAFSVEEVETFARFASSVLDLFARVSASLHLLAAHCSGCADVKGFNVPGGAVAAMHAAARLAM